MVNRQKLRGMGRSELDTARRRNEREMTRLRGRLREGGRNAGATMAALERRRVLMVELCDRIREAI